jgi:hypothetical protein
MHAEGCNGEDADEEDEHEGVVSCCGRGRASATRKRQTSTRHGQQPEPEPVPMRGVSVTPCVRGGKRGSVRFTGSEVAPAGVVWRNLPLDAMVDRDGLVVTNLPSGTYMAHFLRHDGSEASLQAVHVPELKTPVVSTLRARPVTAWPWNGEVTASVENRPEGTLFLWSTGEKTRSPVLRRARPGVYGVCVVDEETGRVVCTCEDVVRVIECL